MSTRALIGILEDGKVRYTYCHWDGYPKGKHSVGETLLKHYNDYLRVEALLSLGFLSSLKPYLSVEDAVTHGEEKGEHDFNRPMDNVTIAYHRDRGDELNTPEVPFARFGEDEAMGAEYLYLWEGDEWKVRDNETGVWAPLAEKEPKKPSSPDKDKILEGLQNNIKIAEDILASLKEQYSRVEREMK